MILVTGAGGKTGQAVIRTLVARGEPVRALIHAPEQIIPLQELGTTETVVGDLLDSAAMTRAMEGVRAVYLIAPNVHPEEPHIGEIAIVAAQRSGVTRMVYHSVLHPQTRKMPHHWQKLAVEEALFESGLNFTVLQPAAYMQNILPYWEEVVAEGVYRVPYGRNGALSLVDLEDVAEVAARVLTDSGHGTATYELAGPEALSPAEIARVLSEVLDRPVEAESVPISEWSAQATASGLEDYAVDALAKMFRYYDRYGLRGNPRVLQGLLDRQPTTIHRFITRARQSSSER